MTSYRDWVVELSNTTGTGAYSLAGAPVGTSYFTFRQRYADGDDEVVYWVVNGDRTKWEKNRFSTLNYGTPDTLSREVVESTNGDAAVSWVGGDTPLRLYVVPDSDAQEFMISMGLGSARPDILKYGLWPEEDGVAANIDQLNLFDGTNDIPVAKVNRSNHTVEWASMPAGVVLPFAGATAPNFYLLCFGQSLLRASYPALFDAIGTTYGSADGTHFNVPDLRGRAVVGKDNMGGSAASRVTTIASITGTTLGSAGGEQAHTLSTAEMPSHVHAVAGGQNTGAFGNSGRAAYGDGTGASEFPTGPQGGGAAHNIMQPSMILNYIIATGGV